MPKYFCLQLGDDFPSVDCGPGLRNRAHENTTRWLSAQDQLLIKIVTAQPMPRFEHLPLERPRGIPDLLKNKVNHFATLVTGDTLETFFNIAHFKYQ